MRRLGTIVSSLAAIATLIGSPLAGSPQHQDREAIIHADGGRHDLHSPAVHYTLRVDGANLSGFDVEMHIRHTSDTFRLAMATHPEYDDRFWRFISGLRVDGSTGAGTVERLDSAVWQLSAPGGDAVVRYHIQLPVQKDSVRAAYRPFLTLSGGLIGGIHSFLYIVGATHSPSRVTLVLPPGWRVATGLQRTADSRTFLASGADVLLDSPILAGLLRIWDFAVDRVPHHVVYWPRPGAAAFDTAGFAGDIERIARAAMRLFGRAPYREYWFLIQDGAFGALEHRNSVTIGAQSTLLAGNSAAFDMEIAHEFFHTWNLVCIRPAEYGDLTHGQQVRSRGLWWGEGLTMLYADLLLRRSGLPTYDSTRITHLERLIGFYTGNPAFGKFSAEQVSLAENGPPGALGDFSASTHLQGELLGEMLDLIIRDATGRRRSIDDLMREMFRQFCGRRGFTGEDIERAAEKLCRCDLTRFFDSYVRGAKAIDFDSYLGLIGMRTSVRWERALNQDGTPAPDLRIYAWQPTDDSLPTLGVSNPSSCWAIAGFHTGDRVLALNGASVSTASELRSAVSRLHVGDSLSIEVQRPADRFRATVPVTGYERPEVRLESLAAQTDRQRKLRSQWAAGKP